MKIISRILAMLILISCSCSDIYFKNEKPIGSVKEKEFSETLIGTYILPSKDTVEIKAQSVNSPIGPLLIENDFTLFKINERHFLSVKYEEGWQYIEFKKKNHTLKVLLNESNFLNEKIDFIEKSGDNYTIHKMESTKLIDLIDKGFFNKHYNLQKVR